MSREKYHFIGIGGIGMSGLARLLLGRNIEVSGSDLMPSTLLDSLQAAGASIHVGHSPSHIPPGATVIYTTGIDEENPEFLTAKKLGCRMLHRSDLLAELTHGFQTIAVAGMHGKTTGSALMTAVLKEAGVDPSFAVGGVVADYQVNARYGSGPYFVIEACESDGTFLKYQPFAAIITNIDIEHMDYFESEAVLMQAFRAFIARVSSQEHLFWCGDDARLASIASKGLSYGFSEKCDCRISNFRTGENNFTSTINSQIVFDLTFQGKHYRDIPLALWGRHNALNGAAVFGLALTLGIPEKAIRKAFTSFAGISRRCEIKGRAQGILCIDDYAHHPVEIQTTLQGVRDAIGERRLIAIYQPHRYTRTRDCLGMYSAVFAAADMVVMTDLYAAGEKPIEGIDNDLVFTDIKNANTVPIQFIPQAILIEELASMLRPLDVVLTLGAGNITFLGSELLRHLKIDPLPKLKVGLIFGGKSGEHEISLISASNVAASLNPELYELEHFAIAKSGHWSHGPKAHSYLDKKGAQLSLSHDTHQTPILPADVLARLLECEILFPVLHGPFGEDGTIQGFFAMIGKPYVGCCHRSAAVCMDKALTKSLARDHGIATLDFISLTQYEWQSREMALMEEIIMNYEFPIFVKPCHLGSSLGVSKVCSEAELAPAINLALILDSRVIVEQGIRAREVEFAVLGNDRITVFPPGEIATQGQVYYYDSKYTDGCMVAVAPRADLPEEIIDMGKELVFKAYKAAGCCGMARVDTFLDEDGKFWLNEINPIPGFTKNSLYPLICNENGLSSMELVDKLIVLGLHQHRKNGS